MSQEKWKILDEKTEQLSRKPNSVENEEYEQKRNALMTKKEELEKFFGKKLNLGQAEEELKWLNKKTGKFQEESKGLKKMKTEGAEGLNHSVTAEKKEVAENKKWQEELELLKESLILIRKEIAGNLDNWKQVQDKLAQDNLEWERWQKIFQGVFPIEEVIPQERENVSQWSRRMVQWAYQKNKLNQLRKNLNSL